MAAERGSHKKLVQTLIYPLPSTVPPWCPRTTWHTRHLRTYSIHIPPSQFTLQKYQAWHVWKTKRKPRSLNTPSGGQWHEVGEQVGRGQIVQVLIVWGKEIHLRCRSVRKWHDLIAYLGDPSGCSLWRMSWTEASARGDIISYCTGKGETLDTVKISAVSRDWGGKRWKAGAQRIFRMVKLFCMAP